MPETLVGPVRRRLLDVGMRLLSEEPVVALHGPRTVGKSTLVSALAKHAGVSRIDLDDPATRAAVAADPGGFVTGPAPVCIDEYQHEPEILAAIKAELNRDMRPGRFVLTGSTTYGSIPLTAQSLTGRMHLVTVWPLSQGEIAGVHETFVERLLDRPADLLPSSEPLVTREEYAQRLVRGGMPLALARASEGARNRWFDDYVRLVVERDVSSLSRVRQRDALPRLLAAMSAQTGQLLGMRRAAEAAGLEESTTRDYVRLLEAVFLVHRLPAWSANMRARVVATPKIHMTDSGLAARLARLTPNRLVQRQAPSLTTFGHLLETFVVNEILKQAGWLDRSTTASHYRTRDGLEVDLVLEDDDGAVTGIEVKASSRVTEADLAGLHSLRARTGGAFATGVVLHLGEHAFRFGQEQMYAMPVSRLWSPEPAGEGRTLA